VDVSTLKYMLERTVTMAATIPGYMHSSRCYCDTFAEFSG